MDIDKRVVEMMRDTTSIGDHRKIMQALEIRRQEPVVQLSLAMFRDSIIFRDMAQSMIFDLSCKVKDFQKEISELNERLDRALEW